MFYGVPSVFEEYEGQKYLWDLHSRQLKDRIVWLNGQVNDFIANIIVSQLLYLDSVNCKKDIKLYINSPGGSVSAGLAIYDTMNYISADVSTVCIGQAASMGAFLLAAGQKGKRYALPNAEIMVHQPLGGAYGQASDIQIQANQILKIKDKLNSILSDMTGQSLEVIRKDTDRDNYMSSVEAKQYGIIDDVIESRPKIEAEEED